MNTLPKTGVVAFGEGAAVELPKRLAAALRPGTQLRLAALGPEGLVALREGPADRGFLCGSLDCFSIAEVFGQIVSLTRTGRLVLIQDPIRRTVSFRDGQVLFASSSEPRERLGKMLVRTKVLTQRQLDEALPSVKPGVRLGQALMSLKLLTPAQLYSAMTALVREIVLISLEQEQGVFLFVEGAPHAEDELKLKEKTRDLMLEGMKRAEKMSLWRRQYPDTMRIRPAGETLEAPLELMPKLEAGADVMSLKLAFAGSEHELLSWIDRALVAKQLEEVKTIAPVVGKKEPLAPVTAQSALELYSALIITVTRALREAGANLDSLRSFLEDPLPGMEQAFEGVTLSDDGTLDLARIWLNCDADQKPVGKLKAYEALDGFVSYALFSAKNQISAELAERLAREFRRLHEGNKG